MTTSPRYSRHARALLVAAMTALVTPACGGGTPNAMTQQERQELEQRLVSLEATAEELRAQVARQQQDSAVSQQEKEQLATNLAAVEQQLAEARRLLDTQDWDGVLVKLDAANAELAQLKGRLATTDGSLEINAALYVGPEPLVLDKGYGVVGAGQLTFSELRYWLSNVKLERQDGTLVALPGSYYLIEAVKEQPVYGTPSSVMPAHRRERVQVSAVPAGIYTGITFSIGVDPTYNDDLSRQAGELHTLKNMTRDTWMWFTSYIFTKTKGTYQKDDGSTAPFACETGGNDDFRTVRRVFGTPATVNSQKQLTVNLRLDAAQLFTELHPSTTPTVGASNAAERAKVSNGFAAGFARVSVENPNR